MGGPRGPRGPCACHCRRQHPRARQNPLCAGREPPQWGPREDTLPGQSHQRGCVCPQWPPVSPHPAPIQSFNPRTALSTCHSGVAKCTCIPLRQSAQQPSQRTAGRGLNQQKCVSHHSGVWQFQVEVPTESASPEASVLGSQGPPSHRALEGLSPVHVHTRLASLRGSTVPLLPRTPIGMRAQPHSLVFLDDLSKGPAPGTVPI